MRTDHVGVRTFFAVLLGAALLAGCGGTGTGESTTAPAGDVAPAPAPDLDGRIVFPPGLSLTTGDQITVRGTIDDASNVISVVVGGEAAVSTDGFATWTATVSLSDGANDIRLIVDRGAGGTEEDAVVVHREGPIPVAARSAAYDSSRGVLYVSDAVGVIGIHLGTRERQLVVGGFNAAAIAVDETTGLIYAAALRNGKFRVQILDPQTGQTSVLTENGDGKGTDVYPYASHIAVDPVAGVALVMEDEPSGNNRLIGVDLITGARAVLSVLGSARYPDLVGAPGTGLAYVLDQDARGIQQIDLATGTIAPVAVALSRVFSGAHLVIDPAGSRAFTSWGSFVHGIDLATGEETTLSADAAPASPLGIWLDAGGQRLIAAPPSGAEVITIDSVTGDSTSALAIGVGTGSTGRPKSLALMPDRRLIFATPEAVLSVDEETGHRQSVSGDGVGAGPAWGSILAIAAHPSDPIAYAYDAGQTAIVEIDALTGSRRVLSDAQNGSGPVFASPIDLAVGDEGSLFEIDDDVGLILRVDTVTGDRVEVSGPGRGLGPPLSSVRGIEYDTVSSMLFVCQQERILRVDPSTGNRETFFDASVLPSPRDWDPVDCALTSDGSTLYAVNAYGVVYALDVASRNAWVVRDRSASFPGLVLYGADRIAAAPHGGIAYVLDESSYAGVLAIDTQTGEAVLIAR